MGVDGLWHLLSPVKRNIQLSECQGKKLAVDLSSWIVQCSTGIRGLQVEYQCYRNLFHRTLSLLSLGISLVFVLDGPIPPKLKKRVKSRVEFHRLAQQYAELPKAIGIPVVTADHEAEQMCALLNQRNIVDGVLTEDGDVFLYGACKVYKGLSTDHNTKVAVEYRMEDIVCHLGMTQRDLVAFSLVSKGDFCDGIPKVGEKAFLDLHKELKCNKVDDVLTRLLEWRGNEKLNELQEILNSLKTLKKSKHCGLCGHEGSQKTHAVTGCGTCMSTSSCVDASDSKKAEHPYCHCQYHQHEAAVKPFKTELKIRNMALTQALLFPNSDVVGEYLKNDYINQLPDINTSLQSPDCLKVCKIVGEKIKYEASETLRFLVPVCIKMKMYGLLPQLDVKPLKIEKKGKKGYQVKWSRIEINGFTEDIIPDEPLTVPAKDFSTFFPEMVKEYESHTKMIPGTKRKMPVDVGQPKMTDMFKVVKTSTSMRKQSPTPPSTN